MKTPPDNKPPRRDPESSGSWRPRPHPVASYDLPEEEEMVLWHKYHRTKDEKIREFFILKYAPLVKYVAGKTQHKLPNYVEFGDIIGWGTEGLIDAVDKYDPNRNIKFKTYGITRILGQIVDEMRKIDWVPRSVRQKFKQIEEEQKRHEEKTGKKLSAEEVSERTGIRTSEVERIVNLQNDSTVGSLDDTWLVGSDNDEISVMDTIQAPESHNPYNELEKSEIIKTIAATLHSLPEKEKQVIILYYYADMTLKEIGAVLEVTESRVSQLHTKALRDLKLRLEEIKKSLI